MPDTPCQQLTDNDRVSLVGVERAECLSGGAGPLTSATSPIKPTRAVASLTSVATSDATMPSLRAQQRQVPTRPPRTPVPDLGKPRAGSSTAGYVLRGPFLSPTSATPRWLPPDGWPSRQGLALHESHPAGPTPDRDRRETRHRRTRRHCTAHRDNPLPRDVWVRLRQTTVTGTPAGAATQVHTEGRPLTPAYSPAYSAAYSHAYSGP